jgi:hypothetical protein
LDTLERGSIDRPSRAIGCGEGPPLGANQTGRCKATWGRATLFNQRGRDVGSDHDADGGRSCSKPHRDSRSGRQQTVGS